MGQAQILQYPQTLEEVDCCQCGMKFAMPQVLLNGLRKNGGGFYCPLGHPLTFGETENDRLKRQLADNKRALELERSRVKVRDDQIAAQKGVNTKLRKRIGAGVCPCCKRTFKQLAAHIHTKHPDYTAEAS